MNDDFTINGATYFNTHDATTEATEGNIYGAVYEVFSVNSIEEAYRATYGIINRSISGIETAIGLIHE